MRQNEPINVLIIDEDPEDVKSIIETLKRFDYNKRLGKIDYDLCNVENIEEYDFNGYGGCHIALIDYTLNKKWFTGNSVSAWVMMRLKIPRMSLTSVEQSNKKYYDGCILKENVYEEKTIGVINEIVSCVDSFNYDRAIDAIYKNLVNIYSDYNDGSKTNKNDEKKILELSNILDGLEAIMSDKKDDFSKTIELRAEYDKSMKEIEEKIAKLEETIAQKKV